MLAMSRALIAKPACYWLDEPSLGLAPQITAQLMRVIATCAKTSISPSSWLNRMRKRPAHRHRAVVLHLGSAVASGDAAEVAANDDLRRYYLGVVVE